MDHADADGELRDAWLKQIQEYTLYHQNVEDDKIKEEWLKHLRQSDHCRWAEDDEEASEMRLEQLWKFAQQHSVQF